MIHWFIIRVTTSTRIISPVMFSDMQIKQQVIYSRHGILLRPSMCMSHSAFENQNIVCKLLYLRVLIQWERCWATLGASLCVCYNRYPSLLLRIFGKLPKRVIDYLRYHTATTWHTDQKWWCLFWIMSGSFANAQTQLRRQDGELFSILFTSLFRCADVQQLTVQTKNILSFLWDCLKKKLTFVLNVSACGFPHVLGIWILQGNCQF